MCLGKSKGSNPLAVGINRLKGDDQPEEKQGLYGSISEKTPYTVEQIPKKQSEITPPGQETGGFYQRLSSQLPYETKRVPKKDALKTPMKQSDRY
tara:strand:+ start:550 stop:834 length:285 start_codon:yes stop_codon:yes gene_type:complete